MERIKDTAIGAPVKGRFIESLFIGPTDWEQMTDFMNLRIQKGEETALTEFDSAGKSLSVYGVSVNNEFDVPHWDMAIMDNWELMIGNWLSGNIWLVSFKISYLCLPLFYETRTTPSCHPSGCAYRQL
ncbi:hypothetical protein NXX20_12025 [Bacteroides stercoris]|nr:hypothetical protein [Bacteroides stercoris]